MDAWSVLKALWLFLPAYVANMSPVFTAKLLPKWSAPIDGGRTLEDGGRMLGDGKTWRGLAGGAVTGGIASTLIALGAGPGSTAFFAGWDFGYGDGSPLWAIFLFGAFVGFMALTGDAVESYFKRRTGRARGAPWIPFDQLDFVAFGLIGMALASPLLASGWIVEMVFLDWIVLATLLIGTVALHLLVNRVGYWLKLKEVPW